MIRTRHGISNCVGAWQHNARDPAELGKCPNCGTTDALNSGEFSYVEASRATLYTIGQQTINRKSPATSYGASADCAIGGFR